jgi:hypothetical protein
MEKYHIKEAFVAGLLGGILLLVLQMLILPLLINVDAWEFPRIMAATLLNQGAPDIAVFLVGLLVPVILTILLTLTMGWIPSTWHPWAMAPVGLTFGTVVFIMYFLFFASIDRQMVGGLNLWHYFAFIAYGIVIAVTYHTQVRLNYKPDNPLYRGYISE